MPNTPCWLSKVSALVLPISLLVVWESLVASGRIQAHLLPPPSALWHTLSDLWDHGTLIAHIGASAFRVALGFALGAGLAVAVGLLVGLCNALERWIDPTFQALRAIPSLAWVPLLLLWLGIDEAPKLTLIAIGAFFPVYLNLTSALRGLDQGWVEVGRIHGLRGWRLLAAVHLPAALPGLLTGLRAGLSLSWMFVVAAELMAAGQGLGYLLTDGRETGRADLMLVAIVVLALLGQFTDGLLLTLEHHLLRWRDAPDAP